MTFATPIGKYSLHQKYHLHKEKKNSFKEKKTASTHIAKVYLTNAWVGLTNVL